MNELLKNILKKYKINATETQIEQLNKYYEMVISWNEKINLTAITEKNEFALKHILDSVLPIDKFKQNAKIVDVGTGAGFPSIPLKIIRPDLDITMLDSLNKRVKFLESVIDNLHLGGIRAIHTRAEDFANNFVYREKFDYAVARAVASLPTLCEYLLPLVKIDGQMVAYKSLQVKNEIDSSTRALHVLGGRIDNVEKYYINEISSERSVVFIKKIIPTPYGYPRDKNRPKTSPL